MTQFPPVPMVWRTESKSGPEPTSAGPLENKFITRTRQLWKLPGHGPQKCCTFFRNHFLRSSLEDPPQRRARTTYCTYNVAASCARYIQLSVPNHARIGGGCQAMGALQPPRVALSCDFDAEIFTNTLNQRWLPSGSLLRDFSASYSLHIRGTLKDSSGTPTK